MSDSKKEYTFGGLERLEFKAPETTEEESLLLRAYAVIAPSPSDGPRSMGGDDVN